MYSRARIAGHPIHPMLIVFPIAGYAATVVALIVHAASGDPFWYRFAWWTNLGGVVMAGVAALPGLVDLLFLPGRSRAQATGLRHMAFNLTALALFVISAVLIRRGLDGITAEDDAAPLVLGLIGLAATMVAGALGSALVLTHHVGVRPTRHSAAGPVSPEQVDDLDEASLPVNPAPPPTTFRRP
jgi:uncharacterized membrane protein